MNDANANTEKSLNPGLIGSPIDSTGNWNSGEEMRADPVFDDFTDRMLGEFRLLRLLGRGGMAEVYLADQTSLSRKVALKILRPEMNSNTVFLKRFEREARAAASLSHPNIVQVFSVGEEEGFHFIAQEYVKGFNLREYLRRKGPPNAQLALHFMKQVLQALDQAGTAGIVHRDIKPENIMITAKGVIKVADFGLAQLVQPDVSKSHVELTQVGTTMGTPLYMSPEQVHGQKLDQRSDLYSFGVTCFHMLAGEPPFHGETAMAVAIQHLNAKPPRLKDRRPDLPPALCQIVHKLLAKEPEKRYPNAAAVLQDVKQLQAALKEDIDPKSLNLSGFEIDIDDLDPQPGIWERFAGWSVGQQLTVYAALCLVLFGIFAGVGWWMRPRDPLATPVPTQPKIPPKETAVAQFNLAKQSFADDEEAWQAVILHSQGDKEYKYKAQEELGVLYLKTLKREQAAKVFAELAALEGDGLEANYRVRALAGQAVLASLNGDVAAARTLLTRLDAQQPPFDKTSPLKPYVDQLRARLERIAGPTGDS